MFETQFPSTMVHSNWLPPWHKLDSHIAFDQQTAFTGNDLPKTQVRYLTLGCNSIWMMQMSWSGQSESSQQAEQKPWQHELVEHCESLVHKKPGSVLLNSFTAKIETMTCRIIDLRMILGCKLIILDGNWFNSFPIKICLTVLLIQIIN